MGDIIEIKVTGLDKILAGMEKFPEQITRGIAAAGEEAGKNIIKTKGLFFYPPETAANHPPLPFYERGVGMHTKRGISAKSENYGKQFYIETHGFIAEIGNRAKYAKWLGGDEQARAMAKIGWRKLWDVAIEKTPQITKVFQAWIDRTIKKVGL